MKISVIIPTRNRPDFMANVLQCFRNQQRKADEIIIVDASDSKDYITSLQSNYGDLPLRWLYSTPSVCTQRNIGIREAIGDWIFLCDDDIEVTPEYIRILESHIKDHPECGACAGLLLQKEKDDWVAQYPVKKFSDLLGRFVFQLPIWGELENVPVPALAKPLYERILKFYQQGGNKLTYAGWPLITSWSKPYFTTKIYSLGANVIKKEWLLNSPYDEVLDRSGIGDNYGVALKFPGEIHVLSSIFVYHHRATTNRLHNTLSYYRRLLALHYFLKKDKPTGSSQLWFLWSLAGRSLHLTVRGSLKMATATVKVMFLVLTNQNPYWKGYKKNLKGIQPLF